jgi:hypothetical protein
MSQPLDDPRIVVFDPPQEFLFRRQFLGIGQGIQEIERQAVLSLGPSVRIQEVALKIIVG